MRRSVSPGVGPGPPEPYRSDNLRSASRPPTEERRAYWRIAIASWTNCFSFAREWRRKVWGTTAVQCKFGPLCRYPAHAETRLCSEHHKLARVAAIR